jgi:hypothetical protein
MRRTLLSAMAALVLLAAAAAPAGATATLTYPAAGQTVPLNSQGTFSYTWSMTPDDYNPTVWLGDSPAYDYSTFDQACSNLATGVTSCVQPYPLPAGTHYVTIETGSQADVTASPFSPMTSFVVPPVLIWGCGFEAEGCAEPTGVSATYVRHPQGDSPYSVVAAAGWINTQKGSISFSFTIRNGSRTLAHVTAGGPAEGGTLDAGVRLYHSQLLWGDTTSNHSLRWHPLATGTHLKVAVAVSSAGHTLTHTATLTQPPR